ncbi:hypothetical protein MTP04_24350 [Lysinibacillus sp. PLM2]|nr:hypothetical protein MTP04_24350 [Lysinibacillus sp. PLM2]
MAEIGSLEVSLSLNAANFNGTISQVNQNMRAMGGELQALRNKGVEYEQSVEGLSKKQDILQRSLDASSIKLQETRKRYDELVASGKATDAQLARAATAVNKAQAEYNKLETQLKQVTDELEKQSNKWLQASKKLDSYSTSFANVGGKLTDIGSKLSVGLTAPITAAGVAVGMLATQFEDAQVKIQNSLDITAEESERFANVAENVWARGFGDSLDSVSNALIRVRQNIQGINDEAELEEVTRNAIILAETFESDVNEVTRAGNNLMTNFGLESQKAFDLMAYGARNGLNFSNEMFDNLAEYSSLFANMGYTAEEYFELMINGTKEGVYNLDYINDVMKEFQIRLKDGSKTTDEAMTKMSKSTQKVWTEFLKGNKTVKDVSNAVLSELEKMDDQVAANQIGVDLFGTKFEDLEADAVFSLKTVNRELEDVNGTMSRMAEAQEQTFSERWQQMLREAQLRLEPIGQNLLDIAEEWLPKLSAGLERATKWFADLGEEGQGFILTLAGIAAAGGPILAGGGMIANGASSVLKFGSSLAEASTKGGLLNKTLSVMSGPAGWVTLAAVGIGGLTMGAIALADQLNVTTEELIKMQEEGFENATATLEQAKAANELASEYEDLRDKSKLTNDQMLEFKDLQNQIASTTSDDKLAELQKRQSELETASGLTNEELNRMIGLDAELQKNAPAVELAFDTKGNAVIAYKDSIVEATNAQLNLAKAELESQMIDNLFNAGEAYDKLAEASKRAEDANREIVNLTATLNEQSAERNRLQSEYDNLSAEIAMMEANIGDYSYQQINQLREQRELLRGKINDQDTILIGTESELSTHQQIFEEQTKEAANLNKQIALTDSQYNQYLDILATEVGITGEQGKQYQQMKDLYNQNAELIKQLEAKKLTEKGLTEEEQKQLEELKKHQTQIQANINKADELNEILGEEVDKFVNIDDGGKTDEINKDLKEEVTKKVKLTFQNILSNLGISGNARGNPNFKGGLSWVGEEGYELAKLPDGTRTILGATGKELLNLPKGTKIYNHTTTKNLLSNELKISSDLSLVGSDLRQIGSDTMAGLNVGIRSASGSVMNTVLGVGSGIENTLRKRLDIHSPSRVTEQIGYWISAGLAEGIESGIPLIDKAMRNVDATLINGSIISAKNTTKAVYDVIEQVNKHSAEEISEIVTEASKKTADEQKEYAEKVADILKDIDNQKLEGIKDFLSTKKELEQLSLVDEVRIWEESLNYFESGTEEKIKAQIEYRDALSNLNNEILSINEQYSTKILEVNEELKKREEELTETYTKAVDDRAKSLMNFTGLFDEFDIKFATSGTKLIRNLESQVEGFKTWQEAIEELSTKAIDEGLLKELTEMGPDALAEVLALNKMTDDQLSKYSDLYKEKSQLAREQAVSELEGIRLSNQATMVQLNADSAAQLAKLETEWVESIKAITKSAEEGFGGMHDIGVNAMKGLSDGLASMESSLMRQARRIADRIRDEIEDALDINSPSRVMKGIGVFIGQGLIDGMDQMVSKVANASSKLADSTMNGFVGSLSSATSIDNSRNFNLPAVNIYTQNSGSREMERTLRRLAFQLN